MPETALVTGASSGIGEQFARQLAARGHDLVLVARRADRLESLAAELPTEAKVIASDLASDAASLGGRVHELGVQVDLLVNNAGFGTYGRFADLDRDGEEREIRVNVVALVRLTHAALGPMVARGHGTILNVSSVAGLQATPGNATYGATKAYVASFSEAVHEELVGTGVTLTAVLPGFTRTEFQQRAGIEGRALPGFAWQSVEDCAAEALAGARAGKAWVVTGRLNRIVAAAAGVAPRGIKRRVAARVSSRL
jgi:uncharacterized protein